MENENRTIVEAGIYNTFKTVDLARRFVTGFGEKPWESAKELVCMLVDRKIYRAIYRRPMRLA